MDELLIKLERRVRIVRSARIESAKRYKKDNDFYKWITIVYSILITCLSIWFVVPNEMIDNARLAPILLTLATFVTLFTMYTSIKNPGEKVGKFQSNYMELTRLLAEIQSYLQVMKVCEFVEKVKSEEYKKLTDKYSSLLTQSENHDDVDYQKAILREEDPADEKGRRKIENAKKKIAFYNAITYTKKVIAIVSLPLIFVIFYVIEIIISKLF